MPPFALASSASAGTGARSSSACWSVLPSERSPHWLTAPKRGSEIRDELGSRAEELATKAKDEWVPIFERATNGAGEILDEPAIEASAEDATATIQEAAADAGETVGDVGDVGEQAASETAEAINDAFDAADRESPA